MLASLPTIFKLEDYGKISMKDKLRNSDRLYRSELTYKRQSQELRDHWSPEANCLNSY